MELTPQLIALGKKIQQCIDEGYKLEEPNFPADKDIKSFVQNMKRKQARILQQNPNDPIKDEVYSKEEVLIALGYDVPQKHKAITMERIFAEVTSYFENGGQKQVNAKDYPFYITIRKFIERENKKGYNYTFDGIMSLMGHYDSKILADRQIVFKYADFEGCVDSMRGTKDYDHIRIRAQVLGLAPAEYVASISPFHFSKSVVTVENYIGYLKQEIATALDGRRDATGLRTTHPELYDKVRHLREYFPEGSLDDIADAFNYLGFDYDGRTLKKSSKPESYYLKQLEALFPDKVVTKIDHTTVLGKTLLRLSLENNMFLVDYLADRGFTYVASKDTKRLTQTNSNSLVERYREILVEESVKYGAEHSPLKTVKVSRTTLSGRELPAQEVVDDSQVIYMPTGYELEMSRLQVMEQAKKRMEEEKKGMGK